MLQRQKIEAEAMRLGLLCGMTSVREVVEWADGVIVEDPQPDYSVIEVSMAGSCHVLDLAHLLEAVDGEIDLVQAQRDFLRRLLEMLEAEPARGEEIAVALYRLRTHALSEEHFGWEPCYLDDCFQLAQSGIYTREDAMDALREYLRTYSQDRPTADSRQ